MDPKNTWYLRLKDVVEHNFDSQTEFAKAIGVSRQRLNDWLNGVSNPSYEYLIKISDILNISLDSLLKGSEPNDNITLDIIKKYNILNTNNADYNQVKIPFFPEVFTSAGNGNIIYNENILEVNIEKKLLQNIGINSVNNISFIKVKGDSMEPLIKEEDILLCRKDKNPIKNGTLYVVRVDNELFVKQIYHDIKNNIITLISKNTIYPPIIINLNTEVSFSIRAKVLGSISFNQFK